MRHASKWRSAVYNIVYCDIDEGEMVNSTLSGGHIGFDSYLINDIFGNSAFGRGQEMTVKQHQIFIKMGFDGR